MNSPRLPAKLKSSTASSERLAAVSALTPHHLRHLTAASARMLRPHTPVAEAPASSHATAIAKRILDLAFALPAALLFPLVLIPVAVALKIDSPGPIFFTQRRTGRGGRPFTCIKFRTLRHNPADTSLVVKDDPRISPFCRFLRRSSIDELPQIFNVLAGDMSVVGPRPHMVEFDEYYGSRLPDYSRRHLMKPGITGWAQVNGWRGATDRLWKMQTRLDHDLWYIRHHSLTLDLKIIARTIGALIHPNPNAF